MRLFDDIVRSDPSPSPFGEDSFSFYNRVEGPIWRRIRETLEAWFAAYPEEHKADLRGRFRSNRQGSHAGAYWELYVHHLLGRLGYKLQVHPEVPDTSHQPDFEATRGNERLYVEAAAVFSGIVDDEADPVREGWIMDAVNKASSPNFFVGVTFETRGTQRPRDRDISRPLESWLRSLDPDRVLVESAADGFPVRRIAAGEWQLLFEAVPVSPESRAAKPSRLLGYGPASVGWVNDKQQLRDTLKHKRGRYGEPDVPLVVAVNCASSAPKPAEIADALYGSTAYEYLPGQVGTGRAVRTRDGTWMGARGPTGQRLSAVLTAVQLHPGSMATVQPWLWQNPWAHHPLTVDWPFSSGTASERGEVACCDRDVHMASLLGLAADWPGKEPRFPSET